MALLLAGNYAQPPAGLSHCKILTVWPQARLPVDDVVATTSCGGAIYVQAKSSLRWEFGPDKDFAKVIGAFVRTYLQGLACAQTKVAAPLPWCRPLDPAKDRLVIAVRADSPGRAGRVINRLAEAAAGSTYCGFLAAARRSKKADDEFEELAGLIRQHASAPNALGRRRLAREHLQALLSCMRVEWYDFQDTGWHRTQALNLLRQQILSDPNAAESAWVELIGIAQSLASTSLEVDLGVLRDRLREARIPLETAPDYRTDAEALRQRSRQEYASIDDAIACGDQEVITIERTIVDDVLARARAGHVLVHGGPGVGKSWVMKQVARGWGAPRNSTSRGECILLRVEGLAVETRQQVKQELGLTHELHEVLRVWKPGVNVFVVDGLDAAREEVRAKLIRQIIESIVKETSWHVVASVRTFDMQHSAAWKRLLGPADGALEVPSSVRLNWTLGWLRRLRSAL